MARLVEPFQPQQCREHNMMRSFASPMARMASHPPWRCAFNRAGAQRRESLFSFLLCSRHCRDVLRLPLEAEHRGLGALQPFCASYGTHGKTADHTFPNRCPVLTGRNNGQTRRIRPCGSDRCLCSGKDRPQSGRCAAGPFRCSTQPAPSASARSTAGCRIVPTRTLATVPSIPLVGIRRPGSLRRRLPSQSPRCWTRSVTHARSARLRIEAKVAATSLLPPVQSAHGPTRSGTGREQGVCRWRV